MRRLFLTRLFASRLLWFGVLLVATGALIAQPAPPELYALPDANARVAVSSSMAVNSISRFFATANMLTNTVSIIEPGQTRVVAEIAVGRDPRTVAFTPDDSRVLAVNRGDGTLSVISVADAAVTATYPVGMLPYGVVALDDARAFVSSQGLDAVLLIDINTGDILETIPTPSAPAGLGLWGDFLYVTHLWTGELSLIFIPQMRVANTMYAGIDTSLSQAVTIDPQRGLAYLPQTRLNAQNTALTFDTVAFPIVNTVDLRTLSVNRRQRIALDTADRPVNMPFAAALDSLRRWLFVANAGSNDISVIDLTNNLAVAHIPVGANPRSLRLSRDNGTLYVHNMIDGTLSIIDTRTFAVEDEIPINNVTIPADILLGAQLFHTSDDARLSQDSWLSCATCHFDGQSAGRVWRGFPGGARNTPLLYDLESYARFTWSGGWDEIADVEFKIRALQAGDGLIMQPLNDPLGKPHSGLSLDMDNLTAYLYTLEGPVMPPPDALEEDLIAQGAEVFTALECATCHSGETYSDNAPHDVGTGGEFITPTLRWLRLSEPYFHDGSAATLEEVFVLPGAHQLIRDVPLSDIEALTAYLMTLPQAAPLEE